MIDYDSDDVMDGDHPAHEDPSDTPTQRDGFTNVRTGVYGILPRSDWVFFSQTLCRDLGGFSPFTALTRFCIGMERIGKRPIPYGDGEDEEALYQLEKIRIVLFPINGVGFGHFTLMYALAKRWKKRFPSSEVFAK